MNEATAGYLAAATIAIVCVGIAALFLVKQYRTLVEPEPQAGTEPHAQQDAAAAPPQRNQAGVRRRRAAAARRAAQQAVPESSSDHSEEGTEGERHEGQQLQAGEAAGPPPPPVQSRKQAYEAKRAARDKAREEQEGAEEAEAAAAEAEAAARQEAEAQAWMGSIATQESGMGEDAQQQTQMLLQQFINFIRSRKSVDLEELAAEFGLRVQDTIDRIAQLEAAGRLTGLMDDRGKYIFISLEEMEAVARYIKSSGRVAISTLAAKSNSLIDLSAIEVPVPADPDLLLEQTEVA